MSLKACNKRLLKDAKKCKMDDDRCASNSFNTYWVCRKDAKKPEITMQAIRQKSWRSPKLSQSSDCGTEYFGRLRRCSGDYTTNPGCFDRANDWFRTCSGGVPPSPNISRQNLRQNLRQNPQQIHRQSSCQPACNIGYGPNAGYPYEPNDMTPCHPQEVCCNARQVPPVNRGDACCRAWQ